MNVLLDENLSPTLVPKLGGIGIAAMHVVHIGKSGASDSEVWAYAYEHDQIVLTINASDFLRLAKNVDLHPGLIVLRAQGLDRDEQWEWIAPVLGVLEKSEEDLVNKVVEVVGPGKFTIRKLPRTDSSHAK